MARLGTFAALIGALDSIRNAIRRQREHGIAEHFELVRGELADMAIEFLTETSGQ